MRRGRRPTGDAALRLRRKVPRNIIERISNLERTRGGLPETEPVASLLTLNIDTRHR
jgi:hypothetical protein